MTRLANAGLGIAATLALLATGGAAFVPSGIYNIADDHHTKRVLALIDHYENIPSLRARVASPGRIWMIPQELRLA
jgi:hypothetical protein